MTFPAEHDVNGDLAAPAISAREGTIPRTSDKKPAYLRGMSAPDLMQMHFEPVSFIIPGLVAEGATLFAGKPKIGKSWLCFDFALSVAAGLPVFGEIPVEQGDVLYLALEDSQRRLKSRLLKKGVKDPPERLMLAIDWPGLDDGCIDELSIWAEAVEKPRLVIIDVLKMVRGVSGHNESVYDADYRALNGLARFARERGIAVLIVHHERKMESTDPLEGVSGSNGLTGAADTVMVLKRDSGTPNCKLYVRGRDVEESETIVHFQSDRGTWKRVGAAGEVGRTDEREAIMRVLRASDKPMTPQEVSDLLEKSRDAVRKTLTRMYHAGEIARPTRGAYTCHSGPNVPTDGERDIGTDVTEWDENN